MTILERLRRVPAVAWAALFALLLVFPLLGSFGFWDPWELNVAEKARDMMRAGHLADTTAGRGYQAEPPLDLALSAIGMQLFGARELGARVGNALFAVGALLSVYWAGLGLFRRRAALLAALALGTMPLFYLQARQLTSDMPLVAGLALALGGLGRYTWPGDGRRRPLDLAIGITGMLIATLSGGALLGVALPALAVAGTAVVARGLTPTEAVAGEDNVLTAPGLGPDVPAGQSFGRGLLANRRGLAVLGIGALGLLVLLVTLATANVAGEYSLLLGGTPRGGTPPQKFEYLIKQIGFGVFPWSALLVFALGRALVRMGEDPAGQDARLAFTQIYLLVFAAFGYALGSVFVLMTGEARFAPLAALALAVGAFLDEALEGKRAESVLGLLVATGTMVVARDLHLAPEELASLHVLHAVKWPPQLRLGPIFLFAGLLVALGIYLGLATRGRALGKVAPREGGPAGPVRRRIEHLVVQVGRFGIQGAVAVAVIFALGVAHLLVPALSNHYSLKPVFQSLSRYAQADEPIAKYRVEARGTAFYSDRDMLDLPSQDRVVGLLRGEKRAFVLVPADELAALDSALKLARVDYVVADASSSRFLLLSNRVGVGQEDRNPLKRYVWMAPAAPTSVAAGENTSAVRYTWPAERPPWPAPRVPAVAEFGNSIELLGADYPPVVRRPTKIPLTLHFRINRRPPGAYKIFVHFDAAGSPRLQGDHAPLDGTLATTFWLPGEYVNDFTEVDVPLMTTPAGLYTLYIGFWPGGEQKRLRVTGGDVGDGFDRVRVGAIDIR